MANEGTTVNLCHTYYVYVTVLAAVDTEINKDWIWGRTQFSSRDFGYIPVLSTYDKYLIYAHSPSTVSISRIYSVYIPCIICI